MQIMFMAFIDRVIIAHGKISMDSQLTLLTGHQGSQMDPTVVIIVSNITWETIKMIVFGKWDMDHRTVNEPIRTDSLKPDDK